MIRSVAGLFLIVLTAVTSLAVAADEDYVDFSDRITPTCELIGLVGVPPEGWFNVPIQSEATDISGCQMMRTNDQEELVGILRLLSKVFPVDTPEETWFSELVGIEVTSLGEMGITLGEPLWRKDDVPMTGMDWENGKAIGLEATIEGNDAPQEVHFLAFGGPTTKYLISLSTPNKAFDDSTHYRRNTGDFAVLIRTMQFPEDE